MGEASKKFSSELVGHLPAMRAFAAGLARSRAEADDLVQEAAVRAMTHHDKYTPGTNMRAWLLTIVRNCFYTHCRRRRLFVETGVEDYDVVVQPDQEWRLRHGELLAALQTLPHYHREALLLVVVHDLSYEDAAKALDCSIGTIKSRVFRARAQLAEALQTERPKLREAHPKVATAPMAALPV